VKKYVILLLVFRRQFIVHDMSEEHVRLTPEGAECMHCEDFLF